MRFEGITKIGRKFQKFITATLGYILSSLPLLETKWANSLDLVHSTDPLQVKVARNFCITLRYLTLFDFLNDFEWFIKTFSYLNFTCCVDTFQTSFMNFPKYRGVSRVTRKTWMTTNDSNFVSFRKQVTSEIFQISPPEIERIGNLRNL